jgi:outer membrane protein assembly factor BamB
MKSHPLLFRTAVSSLLTTALVLTLGGPARPQLADGPWSMYRHDVCHTGQSPNPGPLFTGTPPVTPGATDVKIWHGFDKLRTSPSLSADGKTIFFGMGFDFCAVDTASMTTYDCLVIPADVSDSSPAVGLDGTIYMGDRDNSLNAYTLHRVANPLSLDLTLKWRYNHGHEGDIWQHPAIAPSGLPQAGTIYFSHDQSTDGAGIFTALLDNGRRDTADGEVEVQDRQLRQAVFPGDRRERHHLLRRSERLSLRLQGQGQPARTMARFAHSSADLFLQQPESGTRPALEEAGGSVPGLTASPVISADSNTLYIGTMSPVGTVNTPSYIPMGLTALDISTPCTAPCAAPAVKWTFKSTGKVDQTPALGRDGTLYVPAINGGEKRLYAVNPSNGSLKWTFGPFSTGSESSAQPIVGGDGTVYVGLGNNISALNPATGADAVDVRDDELHPVLSAHRPRHRRPGHPVRALARP